MEERYRVILNGYGEGKGEYYIEEDFAKLFKMTREQANIVSSVTGMTQQST